MPCLDCLEHTPGGPALGSVIWLHGLGADGYDFAPLVPHLGLPQIRFVFPHAPKRPVTINNSVEMPSWYDIRTFDRVPERESEPDIRASAQDLTRLIEREVQRGVNEDRIVLAGFSQGAALSLFTALRHPRPLLGVMVLSGYLVVEHALAAEQSNSNAMTPIFFGHGTEDEVVPIDGGRRAHAAVSPGRPTEWRDYPMAHQVCPEEIAHLRAWLHTRFHG